MTDVRLTCAAQAASVAVLALQTWASEVPTGQRLLPRTGPTQSARSEEWLILRGEAAGRAPRQRLCEMTFHQGNQAFLLCCVFFDALLAHEMLRSR